MTAETTKSAETRTVSVTKVNAKLTSIELDEDECGGCIANEGRGAGVDETSLFSEPSCDGVSDTGASVRSRSEERGSTRVTPSGRCGGVEWG
jgi:hypothetical protein